jgi:hypothetical protein
MRFLLAGTVAVLTAAGLASIRPAVLSDEERAAATAIRENRIRADTRFLASAALEGQASGHPDVLGRGYVASRFEAIGLEPGASGGSWEQRLGLVDAVSGRTGANVVGLLRGRDPELSREAVVYTARRERDNPSGIATLLAIAEAFAALPERPRRSLLFAAVASEEPGLLGSSRLARHPPAPVRRIAASLDVDGADIRGRTHDVQVLGLDTSSLDDWTRAIAEAQPTADRDASGAVENARLLFHLGARVAGAEPGQ